jgi:hypothetical protein
MNKKIIYAIAILALFSVGLTYGATTNTTILSYKYYNITVHQGGRASINIVVTHNIYPYYYTIYYYFFHNGITVKGFNYSEPVDGQYHYTLTVRTHNYTTLGIHKEDLSYLYYPRQNPQIILRIKVVK